MNIQYLLVFIIIKQSELIVKIPIGIFVRLANFLCVNTADISM